MTRKKVHALFIILYCLLVQFAFADAGNFRLPEGFVYVDEVIPDIKVTLPYYDGHNFVGERIDGYLQPRCILTVQAAQALKGVQDELRRFGLSLKIFDCYRPQQAVDHFVRWAKDLQDTRMKAEFYPDVKKENLFKDGYIATKSGHSRGSTVDLTITAADAAPDAPGLNMATGSTCLVPSHGHPTLRYRLIVERTGCFCKCSWKSTVLSPFSKNGGTLPSKRNPSPIPILIFRFNDLEPNASCENAAMD